MSVPFYKKRLPFVYTNAALTLIIINVGVFFLNYAIPETRVLLAMVPPWISSRGYVWQFVTYMFTHANMSHILFNMLGLFFFGVQVEHRMGSYEFVLFYMVTGILAGVFSFLVFYITGTITVLLGASGAVFAVLLAFATYYPDARIFIMGIIPVKSTHLVIGYTAIELFSQFANANSGIAHMTHLAGFGFAFLYFVLRLDINPLDVFRGGSGRGGYWR
jgi:membrane associated rhomboid family serine protease